MLTRSRARNLEPVDTNHQKTDELLPKNNLKGKKAKISKKKALNEENDDCKEESAATANPKPRNSRAKASKKKVGSMKDHPVEETIEATPPKNKTLIAKEISNDDSSCHVDGEQQIAPEMPDDQTHDEKMEMHHHEDVHESTPPPPGAIIEVKEEQELEHPQPPLQRLKSLIPAYNHKDTIEALSLEAMMGTPFVNDIYPETLLKETAKKRSPVLCEKIQPCAFTLEDTTMNEEIKIEQNHEKSNACASIKNENECNELTEAMKTLDIINTAPPLPVYMPPHQRQKNGPSGLLAGSQLRAPHIDSMEPTMTINTHVSYNMKKNNHNKSNKYKNTKNVPPHRYIGQPGYSAPPQCGQEKMYNNHAFSYNNNKEQQLNAGPLQASLQNQGFAAPFTAQNQHRYTSMYPIPMQPSSEVRTQLQQNNHLQQPKAAAFGPLMSGVPSLTSMQFFRGIPSSSGSHWRFNDTENAPLNSQCDQLRGMPLPNGTHTRW